MRNADLFELLAQARESVFRDSLCREYDDMHKAAAMEEHKKRTRLLSRIDAALAEREAEEKVEWRLGAEGDAEFIYYEAYPDADTRINIFRSKDGKWLWTLSREEQSFCDSLDEAKAAAIRAARGLR